MNRCQFFAKFSIENDRSSEQIIIFTVLLTFFFFLKEETHVFVGLYIFNALFLVPFCRNGGTFIMLSALEYLKKKNKY